MKVAVITLFPEMFQAITDYGVSGRAVAQGLLEWRAINPRDFTSDRHQSVDDRPYGGGPGMVMSCEPLRQAIKAAKEWLNNEQAKVIYLSPQGRTLDHQGVKTLSVEAELILLCGRYEGIDERLIELEVNEEWSIGDYVLSGGELPAMVLMDAIIRQLPGSLGHEDSAMQDSFAEGLLDCPHYTRPEVYDGHRVPQVLLSGDHRKIREWRLQMALERTRNRRPELLNDSITLESLDEKNTAIGTPNAKLN